MSTLPQDCCYASGGRSRVIINGIQVAPRSVSVMPIAFERTVGSNQDGSIYTTNRPMPAEADITLSDACGMRIEDIMGCPVDATIELIDVKRTYLFSKGVVVGRPTINTETGEIRNLRITSSNVTYKNT